MASALLQIGVLLLLIAIAAIQTKGIRPRFLLAALAVLVVDLALTFGVGKIPAVESLGLHWNWLGKTASILFSVTLFCVFPTLRKGSGITLQQKPGSWKTVLRLLFVLLAMGVTLGFLNGRMSFEPEALLYQLVMPSLSEEFLYRGSFLFLIGCALNSQIWAVVLSSLFFGLIHSLFWNGGHASFDAINFAGTATIGALLAVIRLRSGSIFPAVLGHSLLNFPSHLIRMR